MVVDLKILLWAVGMWMVEDLQLWLRLGGQGFGLIEVPL